MRWGLGISFTLHAAILLAAIVVLPNPDEFKVKQQESIPVDIVSIDALSQRQATTTEEVKNKKVEKPTPVKTEKKITEIKQAKAAEEIKQVAKEPTPPPPTPKPEKQPEPKKQPAPPEKKAEPSPIEEMIKKTADVKPTPEPKVADSKPVPKPRVKPKPPKKLVKKNPPKKKPELDLNQMAAVLNKIEGESTSTTNNQTLDGNPKHAKTNSPNGSDASVSATELQWLRQRVGLCWNMPAGVENAHNLVVTLQFTMDIGGNIQDQPVVVNTSSDPRFAAAASSAVAAIVNCQPYDMLPPEKYSHWSTIRMNFDPSKMLAIN